jgi:hypothetical protein
VLWRICANTVRQCQIPGDGDNSVLSFAVNYTHEFFAAPSRSTSPLDIDMLDRIKLAKDFIELVEIWRQWHAHKLYRTTRIWLVAR